MFQTTIKAFDIYRYFYPSTIVQNICAVYVVLILRQMCGVRCAHPIQGCSDSLFCIFGSIFLQAVPGIVYGTGISLYFYIRALHWRSKSLPPRIPSTTRCMTYVMHLAGTGLENEAVDPSPQAQCHMYQIMCILKD